MRSCILVAFLLTCCVLGQPSPSNASSRDLTCPSPTLSNITMYNEPLINGAYPINQYNKSWDIKWYAEYNQSTDSPIGENPYNYFERDCNWTLQCNIPGVTNGSVAFYNFTVDLWTPEFSALSSVFLDLVFFRQLDDDGPPIQMFANSSVSITQFRTANSAHNYIFPSASARLPNTPLGQGYILTSNWTETAIVKARFYTGNTSTLTGNITDMGMTLNMHFECDQFFVNKPTDVFYETTSVTKALITASATYGQPANPEAAATDDSDNLGLILGILISLGGVAMVAMLLVVIRFLLRYLFQRAPLSKTDRSDDLLELKEPMLLDASALLGSSQGGMEMQLAHEESAQPSIEL